jgi:uncharacterized protein (DUF1800 family)
MQMALKTRIRFFSLTISLLASLALAMGCGGGSLSNGGSNNGGGGSNTPPPPAPASSVSLTPTSSTIFAGQTVTFKATVNGTTDQTVTWSVNGVIGGNATLGTITAGLYQSPSSMPTTNPVTIQAASVTNAKATASGSVTINNSIPRVIAVTPDSFQSPASFSLTISGTGFVNGAVVNWGSTQLPTTFVSSTQLTASGTQSSVVKTVTLSVDNPNPGASRSNYVYVLTDPAHTVSKAVAARILQQTSWGPRPDTITTLQVSRSIPDFLNGEFTMPPTGCYPTPGKDDDMSTLKERFFVCTLVRGSQLRQRVAFAISQIMVVSSNKVDDTRAFTLWQNMLEKDAFGNYYDLLKDVTLSPVMGNYLDMVNNDKPNPTTGTEPNENYAREVMQLFSIGLNELNPDGTVKLDSSGNPIPTYDQDTIEGFAHAFTGWTYPGSGGFPGSPNYSGPMIPFDSHHDTGSKLLLNGVTIPAGGTAQSDLDAALQSIFNHPNVGPFFCKQLIQRLVTSNPSPEYVGRISAVFANNGSGVRGDLKAVVSAILLDPEARRGDDPAQVQPNDGHLKEPVLLMTNLLRAMNARSLGDGLSDEAADLKQEPMNPPSVFNFFPPDFVIPGTNLLGPEFQIFNSSTAISRANFVNEAVYGTIGKSMTPDLSPYLLLAPNPDQLVDKLSEVMMHGQMSPEMRSTIIGAISGVSDNTKRVKAALYLIGTSSQFQVEH